MAHVNYQQRRQQIEHYFDRTAADSGGDDLGRPVSGIRETDAPVARNAEAAELVA